MLLDPQKDARLLAQMEAALNEVYLEAHLGGLDRGSAERQHVLENESRATRIAGGLRKAPKRGCYFSCRNLAILVYPILPDFAHKRESSPHPAQPCSHSILVTKSAFL